MPPRRDRWNPLRLRLWRVHIDTQEISPGSLIGATSSSSLVCSCWHVNAVHLLRLKGPIQVIGTNLRAITWFWTFWVAASDEFGNVSELIMSRIKGLVQGFMKLGSRHPPRSAPMTRSLLQHPLVFPPLETIHTSASLTVFPHKFATTIQTLLETWRSDCPELRVRSTAES